jgi:hypothetical protein
MTLREMNHRFFVPVSQWVMIFGIIGLCQPWIEPLHRYGLTITLFGLLAFSVATKFAPPPASDEDAA